MKRILQLITHKKTPLILLVLGQAYTLFIWQMQTYADRAFTWNYATALIAILTAFAIDIATAQIAFSAKKTKMHWTIAFVTSIALTAIGVAIALETIQDTLHAAFPIGVFLY